MTDGCWHGASHLPGSSPPRPAQCTFNTKASTEHAHVNQYLAFLLCFCNAVRKHEMQLRSTGGELCSRRASKSKSQCLHMNLGDHGVRTRVSWTPSNASQTRFEECVGLFVHESPWVLPFELLHGSQKQGAPPLARLLASMMPKLS